MIQLDFEDELESDIERRAAHLLTKHKFYFTRFIPAVILTIKFNRTKYVGPKRLLKQLDERMRELEQSVKPPIAWAIVEDRGKSGRLLRFHLLISGTTEIKSYEGWEFKATNKCVRRKITWSDCKGTALFLAKNGTFEFSEFYFGGDLIKKRSEDAP